MRQGPSVLLVGGEEKVPLALRNVLSEAGLDVRLVQICAEARRTLNGFSVPAALFTGMALPDGTWADILHVLKCSRRAGGAAQTRAA